MPVARENGLEKECGGDNGGGPAVRGARAGRSLADSHVAPQTSGLGAAHSPRSPHSQPEARLVKRWQLFPGQTAFFCDGRLVSSKRAQVFYFTLLLIVGTSIPFFAFDCRYLATKVSPAIPVLAALLFLFVISTLLFTRFTDPGIIPRATPDEAALTEMEIASLMRQQMDQRDGAPRYRDLYVKGQMIRVKFCSTCRLFRPPRASHCSICDNCVDRFDHHCPWVGNCVGRRNYRYFCLFIASLSCYAIVVVAAVVVHFAVRSTEEPFLDVLKNSPLSIAVAVVAFFSMWTVIGLCCFHTTLICKNQTTNEDLKASGDRRRTGANEALRPHNPFSRGPLSNFMDFLCGPIGVSLLAARKVVTPEPMLSLTFGPRQSQTPWLGGSLPDATAPLDTRYPPPTATAAATVAAATAGAAGGSTPAARAPTAPGAPNTPVALNGLHRSDSQARSPLGTNPFRSQSTAGPDSRSAHAGEPMPLVPLGPMATTPNYGTNGTNSTNGAADGGAGRLRDGRDARDAGTRLPPTGGLYSLSSRTSPGGGPAAASTNKGVGADESLRASVATSVAASPSAAAPPPPYYWSAGLAAPNQTG